jgi:N-methylhydantoinase A
VPVPKQALPEIAPRGDAAPASLGNRQVTFDGREHFDVPVYARDDLTAAPLNGPLIIEQFDSTTVVPSGWTATLDKFGNIIVEKG